MTYTEPYFTAISREALFRFLHDHGDGGIWEFFDRENAMTVADALADELETTSTELLSSRKRLAAVEAVLSEYETKRSGIGAWVDEVRKAMAAHLRTALAEGETK